MRNFIQIVESAQVVESATIAQQAMSRPGFAEWFRGSKVVDRNGLPTICYHGTPEDFAEFNHQNGKRISYGFNRLGYWFDTDPRTPLAFTGYEEEHFENRTRGTGAIIPCYLSIRKPFMLDSEYLFGDDQDRIRELYGRMKELGKKRDQAKYQNGDYRLPDGSYFDEREYYRAREEFEKFHDSLGKNGQRMDAFYRLMELLPQGVKSKDRDVIAFQEELISEGHDGIYLGDTIADFGSRNYDTTHWWIAFHPHQIKSVFAKNFTAGSHDITD